FLPSPWIMPKPLAQLIGWSKLAEPEVELESVFPNSARPDSVNQDSLTTSIGSVAVDALELDFQQQTWLARTRLGHSLPCLALAVSRQILDLLAGWLAALPALLCVFRPSATVAAPTLARIQLL